jgi:hypothetical protein
VYASFGRDCFSAIRKSASRLLRNHLSQTVRFLEEIRRYQTVPDRYKARLYVAKDSVAGRKYVDMRVMLMTRLLLLSSSRNVRDWVAEWSRKAVAERISAFDQGLLRRQ